MRMRYLGGNWYSVLEVVRGGSRGDLELCLGDLEIMLYLLCDVWRTDLFSGWREREVEERELKPGTSSSLWTIFNLSIENDDIFFFYMVKRTKLRIQLTVKLTTLQNETDRIFFSLCFASWCSEKVLDINLDLSPGRQVLLQGERYVLQTRVNCHLGYLVKLDLGWPGRFGTVLYFKVDRTIIVHKYGKSCHICLPIYLCHTVPLTEVPRLAPAQLVQLLQGVVLQLGGVHEYLGQGVHIGARERACAMPVGHESDKSDTIINLTPWVGSLHAPRQTSCPVFPSRSRSFSCFSHRNCEEELWERSLYACRQKQIIGSANDKRWEFLVILELGTLSYPWETSIIQFAQNCSPSTWTLGQCESESKIKTRQSTINNQQCIAQQLMQSPVMKCHRVTPSAAVRILANHSIRPAC